MAHASRSSLRETLQYTCPICQYTENRVVPYGTRPSAVCPDDHYNPNRGPQAPHTTFMRIRHVSEPVASDGLLRLSGDHGFTFMDEMAHVNWRDIDNVFAAMPAVDTSSRTWTISGSTATRLASLGYGDPDLLMVQYQALARLINWPEDALLEYPRRWQMTKDPVAQTLWITHPRYGTRQTDEYDLWRELFRVPHHRDGVNGREEARRFIDRTINATHD